MTIYKSKDYAEGEKLSYASSDGRQLSVALPFWMKEKIRNEAQENKQSISRYVINLLKKEWEENNTNNL